MASTRSKRSRQRRCEMHRLDGIETLLHGACSLMLLRRVPSAAKLRARQGAAGADEVRHVPESAARRSCCRNPHCVCLGPCVYLCSVPGQVRITLIFVDSAVKRLILWLDLCGCPLTSHRHSVDPLSIHLSDLHFHRSQSVDGKVRTSHGIGTSPQLGVSEVGWAGLGWAGVPQRAPRLPCRFAPPLLLQSPPSSSLLLCGLFPLGSDGSAEEKEIRVPI